MTETPPAPDGRERRWALEAAFGGFLALGLITAAEAALPRVAHMPPAAQPRLAAIPRAVAGPARQPDPPPALIAFRSPLPGYPVISPFGLRQLPWEGGGRLHAGVDIAAPAGLPAVAAADGVVTRVAVDPGYGRFVELKHAAGLTSRYAHLARVPAEIAPGAAVKAGSAVGEIGSTGTSTGAHLHFEIRDDEDRPLNPELFIGRSFAETRDLPLRAALRIPRQVRVAFVSRIPRAKLQAMQAKLAAEEAQDATTAGADTAAAREVAANAGEAAVDASAVAPGLRLAQARPHARFVVRN